MISGAAGTSGNSGDLSGGVPGVWTGVGVFWMTSGRAGTSGTSGLASGEVQSSTVPFATGESDRLPDFSASTCVWPLSWT